MIEERRVPPFALTEGLVGLYPFGPIPHEHEVRRLSLEEEDPGVQLGREWRTVLAHEDGIVCRWDGLSGHSPSMPFEHKRKLVGVNVAGEGCVEHVLDRAAPHLKQPWIGVLDEGVLDDDDPLVCLLDHVAEGLFSLPQLLLALPVIGCLAQDGDRVGSAGRMDCPARGFDLDRHAVLADEGRLFESRPVWRNAPLSACIFEGISLSPDPGERHSRKLRLRVAR